jgi:hypothetical protein
MLPARIDPQLAIVATANGTPWKCGDAPAELFDRVEPAGSSQDDLVGAAKQWIRAQEPGVHGTSRAPRRTLTAADAARVAPALAAARASVVASQHASACFDCVQTGITQGWTDAVAAERAHLVRLRHTPEARAKLQAFLSK